MKLSVSVPDEYVEFLDAYASAHALQSRSAAVQQAIRTLRLSELGDAYLDAWAEWDAGDDAGLWEATAGDGI